ncbi:MAG: hypothetical protein Q9170_006333 [Blastenia crenularia]
MTLNLPTVPTGYGLATLTAGTVGLPTAPGSGGYNSSSIAGSGTSTPTGPLPPPKPTATFIGGAAGLSSITKELAAALMILFAALVVA